MPLDKQLLAERLIELSPKRKLLMEVMINRLKDEILFRKNKSIRFPCMVPDNLKDSYSEQETNFDRLLITYPFQDDQRKMLELFEELGVISGLKTNWLPGIFKKSRLNANKEALLELEAILKSPLSKENDAIAYEIVKDEMGIFLKGHKKPIATPHYGGINHQVFECVYQNPNQELTREAINAHLSKGIHFPKGTDKDIGEIFRELGFEKKLREIFVRVTKNSIHFRNPVHLSDLKKMNIEYVHPEQLLPS